MLCKHCYADIGLFGQKYHECPEKKYMLRPMNAQEKINFKKAYEKKGKPKW
jgi:hypothetical protein